MKNIKTHINKNIRGIILCTLYFVLCTSLNAQNITTKVDTTAFKIGEELKLEMLVKTKPTSAVIFPESKLMGALEVLNSYKVDTLENGEFLKLKKEYGLTHFDAGRYTIPQQKIMINGSPFVTDSLLVEVVDVVVDTTKQKMYDIKPITEVEKPSSGFPFWILYILLGLVALAGVLYLIFFRKTKKEKREENKLPPFEKAIQQLSSLDNSSLLEQSEYKKYYSQLTDVLKKYLEEEVYSNALEQTSDELITKLELLRDSGELPLSREVIQDLKKVLQTSDLVKFAKSQPDLGAAKVDRNTIESVINETKQALPEPTEEELLLNEQYRLEQEAKKKKRKIIYASIAGFAVIMLTLAGFAIKYGYDTVKDTIIGHPTKELLEEKAWIRSEYGNPAIVITTPKVLKRLKNEQLDALGSQAFAYVSLSGDLSIAASTTVIPKAALKSTEDSESEESLIDLEKANEGSLQMMEQRGAKDIIVKQEEYELPKGIEGMRAYGTMSMEHPVTKKYQTMTYQILSFSQDNALQQIILFNAEGDKYGEKIIKRVIESVELKKSEE
ncbi:hypothetical protein [Pseudofulvibacter geojedonensis]|uniref:DUF4381 domain-containing protein n=1 Tax=Pseudofulvibacter geojedonensis TaxID=1123758 RepID=A0ABW3I0S0_9FLAO